MKRCYARKSLILHLRFISRWGLVCWSESMKHVFVRSLIRKASLTKDKSTSLYYENVLLKDMLRLDVLVDDLIIVENKAVESLLPLWYAQVRSYLKLFKKNVGFLLNYNVVLMKQGIRRFCIE
jgi:GxxExxY protein